jgi:hypothetical protein
MTPYIDSRDGRSLSIYGSECQINLLHYDEWDRFVTLAGSKSGLRVTLSYLVIGRANSGATYIYAVITCDREYFNFLFAYVVITYYSLQFLSNGDTK